KNISAEQLEDAARLRAIFEGRKREDRSWTQERLAQECGWKTQSAAQQYLNGLVPLNLDALIKFSLALDVPVTDISPSLGAKILA
ncbi:helix-turn-helix transcriptional regulator, partial [Acinetobacter baumannii]